jgi:uncharacterized cupredoxin-like copper-binding protein
MSTTTREPDRSVRLLPATARPDEQPGDGAPPHRRRRWRLVVKLAAALAAGGLVTTGAYAVSAPAGGQPVRGPGVVTVEVRIDHSHFDMDPLRVHEGTLVEFVVHNADPIDHELVVGDAEVHRRHTTGSERRHPPVPGEVSIAPGDTAMTFYEFTEPGTVVYACHLPGHAAYGMTGEIEVVPTE